MYSLGEDAVAEFLENAKTDLETIQESIDNGSLIDLEYRGKQFNVLKLLGCSLAQPKQTNPQQ